MATMLEYATAAHEAGLCVIPPKGNGSKAPLGNWKAHQHEPTTIEQVHAWYADGRRTGLGAVLGAVSRNVELLEFDDFVTYDEFVAVAQQAGLGELVERIEAGYCEETPNGVHWLYRCDAVEGNQKLAQRLKSDDERENEHDNVKALIETRGEGGYVVLAPTFGDVHPTRKPYKMRSGSFAEIVTIEPDERERLFSLARTFDAMPRTEQDDRGAVRLPGEEGERPGDYFNRTRTWADVLTPKGWREFFTRGGETYWTRPGRDRTISASTNYADSDLLKVFSTSTEFDTSRTYSKFGAYTLLNHGGNFADSARAIRREMPRAERGSSNGAQPFATGIHEQHADLLPTGPGSITTAKPGEMTTGDPDYERLKARLFTTQQLFEMPPPNWLVGELIPENSLGVLWGQSGSLKSFLALDWALCISTGSWWKRRAVGEAQDVLYVAAEGAAGIPQRVRSWSKANNTYKLDRATWLPEAVDILNDRQFGALCRIVSETQPRFMVIDTLARSMPGADENSAQDMGRMIDRADTLKRLSGGAVLLIHHSTKAGDVARGSGSLRAAVDVEMEVKRDGDIMVVYCRKQKDAAEFEPIPLQKVVVDDSCVLSNVSFTHETDGASSHANETARRVFVETFGETGATKAELRKVFEQQVPTSYSHAYRLIKNLVESDFLVIEGRTYKPGPSYYLERSSHRLTLVSSDLLDEPSSSHPPRGSIDPEDETGRHDDAVQRELWGDR